MKERMLLLDKIEPVENLIKNSNNIYELVEMAIESNDSEMEKELETECLELQKVKILITPPLSIWEPIERI